MPTDLETKTTQELLEDEQRLIFNNINYNQYKPINTDESRPIVSIDSNTYTNKLSSVITQAGYASRVGISTVIPTVKKDTIFRPYLGEQRE